MVAGLGEVVAEAGGVVMTGGAPAVDTGGVGVTGNGDGVLGSGAAVLVRLAAGRAAERGLACRLDSPRLRVRGCAGALGGARPAVTDSGVPASPTPLAASRLADQATVAVAAMPSSAAATHSIVRRLTVSST